jgi:flagellar motor switch protein FliN
MDETSLSNSHATAVEDNPAVLALGALAHVEAELSVVIGRTRRLVRDLLALRPGSVIELDRSADELVEVLANGTLVARGQVVVVEGELGVRITEIVSEHKHGVGS